MEKALIFRWPEKGRAARPLDAPSPSRQSPPPLFTHRGGVLSSLDRGANNAHKRRPRQRCSATQLLRAYRWWLPPPPPPRPQIPLLGLRSASGRGDPEGFWRLRTPASHPSEPLLSPKVRRPRLSCPASLGISSTSSHPHQPPRSVASSYSNPPAPLTLYWGLGFGEHLDSWIEHNLSRSQPHPRS